MCICAAAWAREGYALACNYGAKFDLRWVATMIGKVSQIKLTNKMEMTMLILIKKKMHSLVLLKLLTLLTILLILPVLLLAMRLLVLLPMLPKLLQDDDDGDLN